MRNITQTLYADVSEPLASEAANQIYPQSLLSFNSPAGPTHYQDEAYDGRRVYVRTTQDQALPIEAQDAFVRECGVGWRVVTLESSHSPFLSMPDRLADVVEGSLRGFGVGVGV